MVLFEQAYDAFLEKHLAGRSGERRARLARGHSYAEKLFLKQVWWPLAGHFEHLHPEYEIWDWNRKSQFLDFAYITPLGRFGLECDGYQSHVKDMDRERFSYALNRDNFLTGSGWRMLHFSFDDVQSRPEVCRMLLQHALGPALLRKDEGSRGSLGRVEKEILHLAWQLGRPVRPKDICEWLQIDYRTARKHLLAMVSKALLDPVSKGRTNRYYAINQGALEQLYR
ncbi:hypothetical protein GOM71_08235 [Paenibacillus sp. NEAU-GSW1]|nr:hypothetical protein [Paenibacillus sp. NEAU-GSW1]